MKRFLYGGLLLFSAYLAAQSSPQISKEFYQEVPSVKHALQDNLNKMTQHPIQAEDYCKDGACKAQIANPNLSRYANDPSALERESQRQLTTNTDASNIKRGFDTRPKHTINPNDPAYSRAKGIMDNSFEISHGLSSKYYNCESGQECQYQNATKQCTAPTNRQGRCDLVVYPVNVSRVNDRHVIPVNGEFGTLMLPKNMRVKYIDLPALRRVPQIMPGACDSSLRPVTVDIYLNGQKVKKIKGTFDMFSLNYSCRLSMAIPATRLSFSPERDLSSILIDFSSEHYFNMIGHGQVVVHTEREQIDMGWRNNCPALPRECRQVNEVCVEGAQTRYINGVAVYQPCWKKERTYQCNYPNTCQSLLAGGDNTRCTETKRQCKTTLLGQCVQEEATLSCETKQCTDTNLTCGEQSFCLDGSCYEGKEQKNNNFNQAVAALAGLGDAAKSLKQDPIQVFTGKAAFCSKKPIGFSDCCADKGWGQGLGLAQCSEEEKGLAEAKQKGLTIDLGQFCAKKILGVCIRKKKGYCQFDSKMARIIQQQGRPQINLSFGSAKSPECQGLTPEQMQKLNFSNIDFSEFYNDLQTNMQLPNMGEVQRRITDKYKDLGGAKQ